jgi:hypothetical protein
MSDDRETVLASARAEASRLRALQPPRKRLRMRSAEEYAHLVCAKYDGSPRTGQRRIRLPEKWAADAVEHLAIADLFDTDDPTGNEWIRSLAQQFAERTFAQRGAPRHPSTAGLAMDALWTLARQMRRRAADPEGEPIDNPLAYVERIITFKVIAELADEARRAGEVPIDEVLVDDSVRDEVAVKEPGYLAVENEDFAAWIDGVIGEPPFTDEDRDVWRRWKAAGFDQRRMDPGDMTRRRLRDRLHAFLRRLRPMIDLPD